MSERRIFEELVQAQHRGRTVALATVINTSRSAPRHASAKMLVFADGTQSGTVGGGEMESRVVEEALAALGERRPRTLSYDLIDPSRGDPGVCGGTVELYIEPHFPRPQLIVVGCGHVGAAVIDLGHWLGFEVIATDEREDPHFDDAIANADQFVSGPIESFLDAVAVRPDAAIVVVSRNMSVDLAAIPKLIETDADYIGVMGSRRRWRTTKKRLAELGVSAADLDRLHAPIGLELNAETPEQIAVSILAQVVAHSRGGDGKAMTDAPAD
jgi:xanthine dehydrogenase accessory factor